MSWWQKLQIIHMTSKNGPIRTLFEESWLWVINLALRTRTPGGRLQCGQLWTRGVGVKNWQNFADAFYGWPHGHFYSLNLVRNAVFVHFWPRYFRPKFLVKKQFLYTSDHDYSDLLVRKVGNPSITVYIYAFLSHNSYRVREIKYLKFKPNVDVHFCLTPLYM